MGRLFYELFVIIYNLLLRISVPFNVKASKIVHGRKETFDKIKASRNADDRVVWVHCASLGEFEQGRPVIEELKSRFPDIQIYLSFFSSSGYEVQYSYPLADCVFYLPADTAGNADRIISLLQPELAIFIKYEFWYNYIKTCSLLGIPVVSVSTILRPSQPFFKWYGGFYLGILKLFSHFFVQNSETEKLLRSSGIENVTLSGDTRFDRVTEIAKAPRKIEKVKTFKGENALVVLGSTWREDIDLWYSYINTSSYWKFIIAPHQVGEEEMRYIESRVTRKTIRFSKTSQNYADYDILIIDNVGMLSSIYAYATVAYVGGAFGEGLHNILEPATFGMPVIFGKGKENHKYQESVDLVKNGGAHEVVNKIDLVRIMGQFEKSPDLMKEAGDAARKYILDNKGATGIIMNQVERFLKKS